MDLAVIATLEATLDGGVPARSAPWLPAVPSLPSPPFIAPLSAPPDGPAHGPLRHGDGPVLPLHVVHHGGVIVAASAGHAVRSLAAAERKPGHLAERKPGHLAERKPSASPKGSPEPRASPSTGPTDSPTTSPSAIPSTRPKGSLPCSYAYIVHGGLYNRSVQSTFGFGKI